MIRRPLLILSCALWLAGTVVGSALLMRFDSTPGESGGSPLRWPPDSGIARVEGRPTLVLFLHPQCPCSRATLAELTRILEGAKEKMEVCVEYVTPAGAGSEWRDTGTYRRAASIPGARIAVDAAGVEARRFGAETSGHVLVYDHRGRLAFSGGITRARGHEGENDGRTAVSCVATGATPPVRRTFVFGCPLLDPSQVMTQSCCPTPAGTTPCNAE